MAIKGRREMYMANRPKNLPLIRNVKTFQLVVGDL